MSEIIKKAPSNLLNAIQETKSISITNSNSDSLCDFVYSEYGSDLDFPQDNSFALEEIKKEAINTEISFRNGDQGWIGIPLTEDALELVSGGKAALGNVNAAINVNVAVNVNIGMNVNVGLNVNAAVVAAIYVAIGVAGMSGGGTSGFCCFPKGTMVRNSDGELSAIESIIEGDDLVSPHGLSKVVERIICNVVPGDLIYQVNDEIECTQEQLFLSADDVWLAVDVNGYREYRMLKRELNEEFGLEDAQFTQMKEGDIICLTNGTTTVKSLTHRVVTSPETLYSFVLDGNRMFFANDYLVESQISADISTSLLEEKNNDFFTA